MEFQIPSFQERYTIYTDNLDMIAEQVGNDALTENQIEEILAASKNFQDLDVKLRLAFGIQEILLNPNFVNEKQGDLKDCHLMYYKLADLWFAYEAFIKFDHSLLGTEKNKVLWIGNTTNSDYSNNSFINAAFDRCNEEIKESYNTPNQKQQLIDYLKYCTNSAKGSQLNRLNQLIDRMEEGDFDFDFSKVEILTLTYAIRNNYVHNGESTIVPDNLGFRNKKLLLTPLYRNLAILVLESTNISCAKYQVVAVA